MYLNLKEIHLGICKVVSRDLICSAIPLAVMFVGLLMTYRLRWRDFRLVGKAFLPQNAKEFPRISVLIPFGRGEHDAMVATLQHILEQEYPDFEVIVIDQGSEEDAEELAAELQAHSRRIRLCVVPRTAHHVAQGRLALMLGARAAHSEWLLFMTPFSMPASEKMFTYMASTISDDVDAVLGYCNFLNDKSRRIRRAINARLRRQAMWLRALRCGVAMGAEDAGVLIRKSSFLASINDMEGLRLPVGEIDLSVERLKTSAKVRAIMTPETTVLQGVEQRLQISLPFVTSAITRGSKSNRARCFYLRDACSSWTLWLSVISVCAYVGLRAYTLLQYQAYTQEYIAMDIAWFMLTLALFLVPAILMRKACKRIGEMPFYMREPFYELSKPLRSLYIRSRAKRVIRRFSL